MFRTKYGVHVPSTTKLRRGICQRQVDRNKFRPLLYASCSPLTRNFFAQVCSRYVFPLCLGVVLPCRDVCFSIYKSCQHISLSPGLQRLEFLDFSKLPARPRLCLSPPSPTPWFSVPSASSVWSTSLSPSSPSVSRYYCLIRGPLLIKNTPYVLPKILFPFSSPLEAPSLPQDQPPDHPPPHPPLSLKQKHWNFMPLLTFISIHLKLF